LTADGWEGRKGIKMKREKILQQITNEGAVAVVRMKDEMKFIKVAEALFNGGVNCIEITMTVPNAFAVLQNALKQFEGTILFGMGSVLNREDALKAIDSGAQYIVSPVFLPEIIRVAHENNIPVIPGCFTPTEIHNAWEAGADIVKVFPADVVGMAFFKALKAPMPHLKMMPTGGVTPENAGDWLKAGAVAVGIGSSLLDNKAINNEEYFKITEKAKILRQSIINGQSFLTEISYGR
jgi:2-dehydro-3-deoxyphosphogluconate aldolase / (4S)-4-hydroxy-2-oxoglutarate aldolase